MRQHGGLPNLNPPPTLLSTGDESGSLHVALALQGVDVKRTFMRG